jgi:hypothetical protein
VALSEEELRDIEQHAGHVFGTAQPASYDDSQVLCNEIGILADEVRWLRGIVAEVAPERLGVTEQSL